MESLEYQHEFSDSTVSVVIEGSYDENGMLHSVEAHQGLECISQDLLFNI